MFREAASAGVSPRAARIEGGSLNGRFEVAEPSSEYKVYMNWTSKKR